MDEYRGKIVYIEGEKSKIDSCSFSDHPLYYINFIVQPIQRSDDKKAVYRFKSVADLKTKLEDWIQSPLPLETQPNHKESHNV
jgi:hypothetical protein